MRFQAGKNLELKIKLDNFNQAACFSTTEWSKGTLDECAWASY